MRLFQTRPRSIRSQLIECLESRQLLAADLFEVPPALNGSLNTNTTLDLSTLINSRVRFATNQGDIDLELFDAIKPVTVTNFLNYVTQGRYDGTIVHRVTTLDTQGIGVIQGGGFMPYFPSTDGPAPQHISTDAEIVNEARTNGVKSNVAGTIAMARTTDPDSATSEWFINVDDNNVLDPGTPASDPSKAGYAVFGQLLAGLDVAQAIQQLPNGTIGDPQQSAFQTTPLLQAPGQNGDPLPNTYITLDATTLTKPSLTFSVQSNNPAVATASIEGNNLVVNFGPSQGVTTLAVTASDGTNSATHNIAIVAQPAEGPSVTVNLGGANNPTSVAFIDTDGTASTLTYKGAGTAAVKIAGESLTQATVGKKATITGSASAIQSIAITGNNSSTALTLTSAGGNSTVDVSSVSASGAMKSLSLKPANYSGSLSVTGGVSKFDIGNVTNSTINLGGDALSKPLSISIGTATSSTVTTNAAVKSFTAAAFEAGDAGAGQINTRDLSKMTVAGNMANTLVVNGALKNLSVGGDLTGNVTAGAAMGTVTVGGDATDVSIAGQLAFGKGKSINKVTIGGTMLRSLIRSPGNIGNITVGNTQNSIVAGGLTGNGAQLPTDTTAFASQASIASFTNKGTYASTNIVAAKLGKINLGTLSTPPTGGLGADSIASVSGSLGGSTLSVKKLNDAEDVQTAVGDTDLGTFRIAVV